MDTQKLSIAIQAFIKKQSTNAAYRGFIFTKVFYLPLVEPGVLFCLKADKDRDTQTKVVCPHFMTLIPISKCQFGALKFSLLIRPPLQPFYR